MVRRRYSDEQVIHEANVFLKTPGGVLAVAKLLKVPKSTIHFHITKRLGYINLELWLEVRKTIAYNKKHHTGGR